MLDVDDKIQLPGSFVKRIAQVAIQGEPGSNSHMAADIAFASALDLLPCASSQDVFDALASGLASHAVLPIENSLHGAVFEHYDLLLDHPVQITGEVLLRIRHHVMAMPGTPFADLRQVASHPVALSQCRKWLRAHSELEVLSAYDTAGSVKQLMSRGDRTAAGIAPALAAEVYGAQILVADIEDHTENYTRFYVLAPARATAPWPARAKAGDKLSIALKLQHRPGALLAAIQVLTQAQVNLTKIESRPVPGRPWEYVFFVDAVFEPASSPASLLAALEAACLTVEVLGIYPAASSVVS